MRPVLVLLLTALGLAACTVPAPTPTVTPAAPARVDDGGPRTVAYRCTGDGNLTARFHEGTVRLFLPGRSVLFPLAVSASGARYAGAGGEFWDKGGQARLTLDGRQRDCVALDALDPWSEARLSGVSFRALGHEPEWLVEVRPTRGVTFSQGLPPVSALWPYDRPRPTDTGRVWTLSARQGSLTVFVTPRPCRDSMSGETFPETVTVIAPTGTVQGCGRTLD